MITKGLRGDYKGIVYSRANNLFHFFLFAYEVTYSFLPNNMITKGLRDYEGIVYFHAMRPYKVTRVTNTKLLFTRCVHAKLLILFFRII